MALDSTGLSVSTILDAHYPGELGGDAVTAVLFGDYSPAGRLTTTIYPPEFVSQRNMTDYVLEPHTNGAGQAVPGITYLYYNLAPQWPFGFGLSYTTFAFTWLSEPLLRDIDAAAFSSLPPYAVNVTNTGSVTSDVSVLAFVATGVTGEPIQLLFDFQRTSSVKPGQSVEMYFTLPPDLAAVVTKTGSRVLIPGTVLTITIGDVPRSAAPEDAVSRLTAVLTVTGDQEVLVSSLPPRK